MGGCLLGHFLLQFCYVYALFMIPHFSLVFRRSAHSFPRSGSAAGLIRDELDCNNLFSALIRRSKSPWRRRGLRKATADKEMNGRDWE
jgi:hypothetical protein